MITVKYKPRFLRECKKFDNELLRDVYRSIDLFAKDPHDSLLRTHRLKGPLKGFSSFSVNYRYRIVFEWENARAAVLHLIGDHDVYR